MNFDVVGRGLSGEVAQGAADRMKKEVDETKPDLVVWQVGTNDALRHVSLDKFKTCLSTTLAWLAEHKIDVVLIDPQYGDVLTKDEHYERVVAAVAEVAREARVLLVDRFEAMKELQRERGDTFYLTGDNLHLNDRGHRCMAEQLTRAIVAGLLQADSEQPSRCSIPDRCRGGGRRTSLDLSGDQPLGVVAVPFGGAEQAADLAALASSRSVAGRPAARSVVAMRAVGSA